MVAPAKEARLAAAAKGFSEVVSRGKNQILCKNPATGKFSLDVGIGGGWHYGAGLECDSAWEADTGAWQYKMIKADFQLHARNVLNAGNLIEWSDPATGESVVLQPLALNWVNNSTDARQQIALPQAVTAQVTDDILHFQNGYGTGRHFRYQAGTLNLMKKLIIDAASYLPTPTVSNPYLELEFIFAPSAGVTLYLNGGTAWDKKTKTNTATAIQFRTSGGVTVWSFRAPTIADAAGNSEIGIMQLRKQGANFYVTVRFSRAFVLAATYPIVLDPTVDYQVGAGGDDGFWDTINFRDGYAYLVMGRQLIVENIWARWTGVTISAGATIDVAYVSFYYYAVSGTPPACTLYFEDAANPAAPTTKADANARVKTTANISVTGPGSGTWWNTNSIVSIIQELVNSYSYAAGAAMQLIIIGAGASANDYSAQYSYDGNASYAPKLHIEFTAVTGKPYYAFAQQ